MRVFAGILMLLLSLSASQPVEAAPIPYSLTRNGSLAVLYDAKNGLPASEANAVVQTIDGFIWIGGYGGLTRYDGKTFLPVLYQGSIINVTRLFTDSRDNLWIGTNQNGLALYNNGVFRFFTEREGLRSNVIRALCERPDHDLVIGTPEGINYLHPDGTIEAEPFPPLKNYIKRLVSTAKGYAGLTSRGDFFLVEDGREPIFIPRAQFGELPPSAFLPSDAGGRTFLIGTSGNTLLELTIPDDGAPSISPKGSVSLNTINDFFRDPDGRLWLCADNGIGLLTRDGEEMVITDSPLHDSVDAMMMDYEGNFWFASSRRGVQKITHNRFRNISAAADLPELIVNAAFPLPGGGLYVGTDKGLYLIGEGYMQIRTPLTDMLAKARVRHIARDGSGNLWFSTYTNGLVRLAPDGTIRAFSSRDGLPGDRIRSVLPLQNGELAVAARNGIFWMRDGSISRPVQLNTEQFLTLCETKDGTLYGGTDGSGVYIFRDGKLTGHIGPEEGLADSVVLRICEDPMLGGIWILTGKSMGLYKDGRLTARDAHGLTNCFDMAFSPDGAVWIFCLDGVHTVASSSMLPDAGTNLIHYGIRDGLPGNVTANSFSAQDGKGKLYLCLTNGIASIDSQAHLLNAEPFRLSVPAVTVDGHPVFISKPEVRLDGCPAAVEHGTVRIPADTRRLSISGHVLTNSLNNPLVRCYLEGFDEKPVQAYWQDLRELTYTNLRGGTYVFHLGVLDETGKDLRQELRLTIIKEPQFHERGSVILIAVLVILLALYAVFRVGVHLRTRKLLARQQESRLFLNQIIQAFAHTIDIKDAYTNGHSHRVAEYSAAIARELGMPEDRVEDVYNIGMLHDVGKIVVPDEILCKKGKLTSDEFAKIRRHVDSGGDILKQITSFPDIYLAAKYHHERMDGHGYNEGLLGEKIPFIARIVAVADTFDAMNSTRPYRKRMNRPDIEAELQRCSGSQLDPELVKVMLHLIDQNHWCEKPEQEGQTPEEHG